MVPKEATDALNIRNLLPDTPNMRRMVDNNKKIAFIRVVINRGTIKTSLSILRRMMIKSVELMSSEDVDLEETAEASVEEVATKTAFLHAEPVV